MTTGERSTPATIAQPNLDDLPERGMGLFIINQCMDEVHYQRLRMVLLAVAAARGSTTALPAPALEGRPSREGRVGRMGRGGQRRLTR